MGANVAGSSGTSRTKLDIIRRRVAENSLNTVESVLADLEQHEQRIEQLREELDTERRGVSKSISDLEAALDYFTRAAKNSPDVTFLDIARIAQDRFEAMKKSLHAARTIASELISLEIKAYNLQERKYRIRTNATRHLKHSHSSANHTHPWSALKDLEMLWSEGLDLVSGLCLRHAGLDSGLCDFADQIISEVKWKTVRAMAVPGRGGPGIISQTVHLRFPEWTVWALPLTPFELWHLGHRGLDEAAGVPETSAELQQAIIESVENDSEARSLRDSLSIVWSDDIFKDCLADVFGIYSMGSAYAYAAMWMILNPLRAGCDRRVSAMLQALSKTPEYLELVCPNVTEQWQDALTKVEGLSSPLPEPYRIWINAQLRYLERTASPFRIERWKELRIPLITALKQGQVEKVPLEKLQMRYVLNVAWDVRVQREDPEEIASVEQSARTLLKRLRRASPAVSDSLL